MCLRMERLFSKVKRAKNLLKQIRAIYCKAIINSLSILLTVIYIYNLKLHHLFLLFQNVCNLNNTQLLVVSLV